MGVRFKGWGIGLPDRIVTNDELSLTLDTREAEARSYHSLPMMPLTAGMAPVIVTE